MTYGPAMENDIAAIDYLKEKKQQFQLYIDGQWKEPLSKTYFDSINPSTKEKLASIAEANKEDVDIAVKAAKKAQRKWMAISGHQRARYLYAIARQIQKNARLFAVLESLDNGKTIRESRDIDIPLVARHFYHHAGWAQLKESKLKDHDAIGVIGQIIPWNFPLLMLAWKIAPALAMGNTLVLKPAESTSLTALLFADICKQIGLPDGVINVVTGPGTTGAEIVNHKDIQKIAFTGSTEVGRIIRKAIAGSGKKLSLELGGKSPFIVFEDADLDNAVEGIVDAIWFNQGQVCCAGSRLLVQESISEVLFEKIKTRMKNLRIGNALDKTNDIGAIIDDNQLKVIQGFVNKAKKEGNSVWQDESACPKDGFYYPPTLITDVSPSSTVSQEEIFGPVLAAMTFRSHQEAIKLANNTKYGLACSIYTENINLALDIAPKIKAGVAWINCSNIFDAAAGFGGYKESGFGREGGLEGLYEYMKPKIEHEFRSKSFTAPASKTAPKKLEKSIDRTTKLYIGGKQVRSDSGYSRKIEDSLGNYIGEVSDANRKDIRNAVEAAHKNKKWGNMTGHARAQVLYYLAENLAIRSDEFASRIVQMTNRTLTDTKKEVEMSIDRIYTYAALADKYDGQVHSTIHNFVTLAMPESIGVMGLACPEEFPLLGFLSLVLPNITMGNVVIVIPSSTSPFSATDFYQLFETSDVPAGTVNIVTGDKDALSKVLADHDDVDGIWYFGDQEIGGEIEFKSSANMKRSYVNFGKYRDWMNKSHGEGELYLRQASQIKNIWIPYGA